MPQAVAYMLSFFITRYFIEQNLHLTTDDSISYHTDKPLSIVYIEIISYEEIYSEKSKRGNELLSSVLLCFPSKSVDIHRLQDMQYEMTYSAPCNDAIVIVPSMAGSPEGNIKHLTRVAASYSELQE